MKILRLLNITYGVIKYDANETIPEWILKLEWYSITKTDKELSVVCPVENIPDDLHFNLPLWKALYLEGPIAFEETGVILSIIAPISSHGLEVFVTSTYNGDLFLFKEEQFATVIELLKVIPTITITT